MEKIYSVLIERNSIKKLLDVEKVAERCNCKKFECQFDESEHSYYGEYYFDTLGDVINFKEVIIKK